MIGLTSAGGQGHGVQWRAAVDHDEQAALLHVEPGAAVNDFGSPARGFGEHLADQVERNFRHGNKHS